MAERDTPQGTAEITPVPVSKEAEESIFDQLLGDLDTDTEEEEAPPGDPSDADEADDEDAPPDDEGDADDVEIDQPRDAKGRFVSKDDVYKTEDGEEVTVEELYKGRLRQQDYTRKNQARAELEREAEATRTRAVELLQQFEERNRVNLAILQKKLPKEPDPATLESDPIGYMKADREYRSAVQELQEVFADQQQVQQALAREQAVSHQQYVKAHEERVLSVIPDLANPKKAKALGADYMKFATEVFGFSPEELRATVDSRVYHILDRAVRWEKLERSKGETARKVEGKPPVTPGRRQEPKANQDRSLRKAAQVLASTGGHGQAGQAAGDALLRQFVK